MRREYEEGCTPDTCFAISETGHRKKSLDHLPATRAGHLVRGFYHGTRYSLSSPVRSSDWPGGVDGQKDPGLELIRPASVDESPF
jgi:hypothetical protein